MASARWCAQCGNSLPVWAPADQVYDRDSCRKAASRANAGARVDRIAAMLRVPVLTASVQFEAMRAGPDPMGETWAGRARWFLRHEPTDAAWLGGPAVVFAMARPLSAGVCRLCYARKEAWVMGEPPVEYNDVTRRALGQPCSPSCAAALGLKPAAAAVTASATPKQRQHITGVGRCACGRFDSHASVDACRTR